MAPRLKPGKKPSRGLAAGPVRWALLGQAAIVLRDHWQQVPAHDRARLAELLKASKGRPANLTPKQRDELTAILRRFDVMKLGRDLAPIATRQVAVNRVAKKRF